MNKILHLLLLIIALFHINGCGASLGSKEEYGVLQGIEYEERKTILSKIDIRMKNGYVVAGFRATSGLENTWVLLNPRHSPYYKQIPQVQFSLTRSEMEMIRNTSGVSETVVAVLETRIRENGN